MCQYADRLRVIRFGIGISIEKLERKEFVIADCTPSGEGDQQASINRGNFSPSS